MGIRKKRSRRGNLNNASKQFNLDHLIKLEEFPIEQSMQMLKEAGIEVEEDDAIKIMEFLYLFARITIKEIFTPD